MELLLSEVGVQYSGLKREGWWYCENGLDLVSSLGKWEIVDQLLYTVFIELNAPHDKVVIPRPR